MFNLLESFDKLLYLNIHLLVLFAKVNIHRLFVKIFLIFFCLIALILYATYKIIIDILHKAKANNACFMYRS